LKRIIQTRPTVGNALPYQPNEQPRVFGTRLYWEVEIPIPVNNRTGPPDLYLVLYLIPKGNISIALANPSEGIHEVIEAIMKEKEYELAFRREWPLFDNLLVEGDHVLTEFAKRPLLISIQDPDDGVVKWMVGRQMTVPPRNTNNITEVELGALDSLIKPTLRLFTEFDGAFVRVGSGLIKGEYTFPKSKFDKFMVKYEKAMDGLDHIKTVLEAAFPGR
jgi:hypothetical protein